jgi:hypothetical protein|tara:strand:+ start:2064 stop:2270 length:207 start_codon:yes stop_codon:yes gene_type:complete
MEAGIINLVCEYYKVPFVCISYVFDQIIKRENALDKNKEKNKKRLKAKKIVWKIAIKISKDLKNINFN